MITEIVNIIRNAPKELAEDIVGLVSIFVIIMVVLNLPATI